MADVQVRCATISRDDDGFWDTHCGDVVTDANAALFVDDVNCADCVWRFWEIDAPVYERASARMADALARRDRVIGYVWLSSYYAAKAKYETLDTVN